MPRNRVQHQKGLSDDAFEKLYPDEEACRRAWVAWRWPGASGARDAQQQRIARSATVNCCDAEAAGIRRR
jgi:hypothetical protein